MFTFPNKNYQYTIIAALKAHFSAIYLTLPPQKKKNQEIQCVLLAQRILLKATDVLSLAVLYALYCKKKTKPPTQVAQKGS